MATLELDRVVKRYGELGVVHGVSLDVPDGAFCVLVGPSGCGKSTLLRMIAGLEPISEGEIRIGGKRVNELGAAERGLAMVFQSYALYPHMSVRQNLSFGLENLGTTRAEIDRRIAEAARMLQIEKLLARKPRQLSGGQRQRVAIGRAVVREPAIFLFDEPLSNLDAELRVQMRIELAELHQRLGNTMVYVTHDQVEAMTMADIICVLRDGRVEQIGRPLDLYNHPANRFVAGFIGSPRMNFLSTKVRSVADGTVLVEIDGLPPLPVQARGHGLRPGDALTLGVRPQHLTRGSGAAATFPAKVDATEQLGAESFLYCRLPGGQTLTVHEPQQTRAERNSTIDLTLDPATCHLFASSEGEPALAVAA